jgi:hypothetical protein
LKETTPKPKINAKRQTINEKQQTTFEHPLHIPLHHAVVVVRAIGIKFRQKGSVF